MLHSLLQFSPEKMTKTDILAVREQIQEDILCYASLIDDEKIFLNDDVLDALCDIVCDNFTPLLK